MQQFKFYCDQVGYNRKEYNPPQPVYEYFAYKDGKVMTCKDETSAKKFSKMVEKVIKNKKEIDAYWKTRQELESKATELWYNDLKSEYGNNLTDAQFSIIYNRAYDRGHSDGYDSVADEFDSLYEFFCELQKTFD